MGFRSKLIALVTSVCLCATPLFCADGPSAEVRHVKAEFLFNFLKFIEWSNPPKGGIWLIGVIGAEQIAEQLSHCLRGRTVHGRIVQVRQFTRIADAKDCQILFLGRDREDDEPIPVKPGLLTVGETPRFLDAGGAVNFYMDSGRVRFEIRPAIVRAVGLHPNAQLLKLGRVQ
jgi:hypothetical protein